MLADHRLIVGEVDAESLVTGDVGMLPLYCRGQIPQNLIGFFRGAAKLLAVQRACLRDIPFRS